MPIPDDVIFIFGGIILACFMATKAFSKRKRPKRDNRAWTPRIVGDSSDQLRVVMSANFSPKRIMSRTEARVFEAAEQALAELAVPWRVMAQVSLGEILSSPDDEAHRAINAKRVDLLLVSEKHLPVAAIKYQGSGHYLTDAAARDAVKKEALRRAGIGYIEIMVGDTPVEVKNQIIRLIDRAGTGAKALTRNKS